MIPRLRARGLSWDIAPGISFLNASSLETALPVISEDEDLAVVFVPDARQLDDILNVSNVVVLYNPSGVHGLAEYIKTRGIDYAVSVSVGRPQRPGTVVDLVAQPGAKPSGLVILRRPSCWPGRDAQASAVPSTSIAVNSPHFGPNAHTADGLFVAACYPNCLRVYADGSGRTVLREHRFRGRPQDFRGLFVTSRSHIYCGLKGHVRGAYGRSYVSRDHAQSFSQVMDHCFWAMDEDQGGNLFAGIYHEKGEPDGSCSILWSGDNGNNWTDIASPLWREQLHVHHLAVNPATGWLYTSLGDRNGLNGCWRCQPRYWRVVEPAPAGSREIRVDGLGTLDAGASVFIPGTGAVDVRTIKSDRLRLGSRLRQAVTGDSAIMQAEWVLKFGDTDNSTQYCGICFIDDQVFLADDNGPPRNPTRTLMYRGEDDGSDAVVVPAPVLEAQEDEGWGVFYFERHAEAALWAASRPIGGTGRVRRSDNGVDWTVITEAAQEDIPCWRGTHTFRDGTLGQTGDGRFLSDPDATVIVPRLAGSTRLSAETSSTS